MHCLLNNIKIVLCDTSHNGNIGAAARAMKTMGLMNLVLVAPVAKPDDHSLALACNAKDVVENAYITDSLEDAISDTTLNIALTARKREFGDRLHTPKEITPEVFDVISRNEKIAFVFGAERTGLTIHQLERCNRLVTIPGNPDYFSLNLAQAVQIICYEIYSTYNPNIDYLKRQVVMSSANDNLGILNHLDQILKNINYYQNKNADRVYRRLQNILHKANLEREEVDLIRGILRSIEKKFY